MIFLQLVVAMTATVVTLQFPETMDIIRNLIMILMKMTNQTVVIAVSPISYDLLAEINTSIQLAHATLFVMTSYPQR